jgi:hypothetical protein
MVLEEHMTEQRDHSTERSGFDLAGLERLLDAVLSQPRVRVVLPFDRPQCFRGRADRLRLDRINPLLSDGPRRRSQG